MEKFIEQDNMRELTSDELLLVSGGELWKNIATGGGALLGGMFGPVGSFVGGIAAHAAWEFVFE